LLSQPTGDGVFGPAGVTGAGVFASALGAGVFAAALGAGVFTPALGAGVFGGGTGVDVLATPIGVGVLAATQVPCSFPPVSQGVPFKPSVLATVPENGS